MSQVPGDSWTIHKTRVDDDGAELFVLLVVDPDLRNTAPYSWNSGDEMLEHEVIALLKQIGVSNVAIGAALHRAREGFGLR